MVWPPKRATRNSGKYLCGLMEETENNAQLVQKLD